MPTYEYQCAACGHELEEFQSMSAKPLRKCPQCGKNKLQRLIGGGAGLIFKGSGFYQTDYRSENYKQGAKAEAPAGSAGKSSESSGNSSGSSGAADSGTKPDKDKTKATVQP